MGTTTSYFQQNTRVHCRKVTLEPNKYYLFNSSDIGSFILKGGSSGIFTIQNTSPDSKVTINDDQGTIIFVGGDRPGDHIIIQDDLMGGTSSVIYSGYRLPPKLDGNPIPIRGANYKETADREQFFWCWMHLTGSRSFIINQSHWAINLEFTGTGSVTVTGDLSTLKQAGYGEVKITGKVCSVAQDGGGGRLFLDGDVVGTINQDGVAMIDVKGNVGGSIEQGGDGEMYVRGRHDGLTVRNGNGLVRVGSFFSLFR